MEGSVACCWHMFALSLIFSLAMKFSVCSLDDGCLLSPLLLLLLLHTTSATSSQKPSSGISFFLRLVSSEFRILRRIGRPSLLSVCCLLVVGVCMGPEERNTDSEWLPESTFRLGRFASLGLTRRRPNFEVRLFHSLFSTYERWHFFWTGP
ncbi:uncharacterized protein B0T23DRAFT_3864 [Neurospora hispaniola]|uniref:Uncharacterized protein n=1 Tax=Neurospora hispaniola TaxID=588809 RepID=A0AAJ0MUQ6_9PEZI|nr:hypothetical protein B0T23DRAFT_3864 [Neurospora hispaniola]